MTSRSQAMHKPCTTCAQGPRARKALLAGMLTCSLFLGGCSVGSVVAGTVGAAGAVAGTAVDVVLRSDVQAHGLLVGAEAEAVFGGE